MDNSFFSSGHMVAHADVNNFYVSCERVFNPRLHGRPCVVLSNNDGAIISRSNEAKALGIAMGVPEFKVRDELSRLGITELSSNYELYGDMSARVMGTLSGFASEMEAYSVDEAFLGFSGILISDYRKYGLKIVREAYRLTGMSISLGIAPTKTLAKVATRLAKKI